MWVEIEMPEFSPSNLKIKGYYGLIFMCKGVNSKKTNLTLTAPMGIKAPIGNMRVIMTLK